MRSSALVVVVLAATILAGCSSSSSHATNGASVPTTLPTLTGFTPLNASLKPQFLPPLLIDSVRAGGEPVIAITPKGTILISSHPGFTHYHPSSDMTHVPSELVQDFGGQTYMFRSTDNGKTWTPIGAPDAPNGLGPRSTGIGVSDPDFTVMDDGTVCHTDLESLVLASTECSTDDGVTWLPGNPIASGAPIDRQWLASYKQNLYFTGNYLAGGDGSIQNADFRVSTDRGVTWTSLGKTPCNGDVVARPTDGHLFQACGAGITVSDDGGKTWSDPRMADPKAQTQLILNEPGIDSAGHVWVAYADNERSVWLAGSPDEGMNWPWMLNLTPHFHLFSKSVDASVPGAPGSIGTQGSFIWPWVSAGSKGRVSVSWIGSFDTVASTKYTGPWYIFNAIVLGADTPAPGVVVSQLTPKPMHTGPICQSGTTCEISSVQGDPSGDRRLGDFFETTIGKDGYLYATWANTQEKPDDVISHPQFTHQVGGLRLIADDELGNFTATQG